MKNRYFLPLFISLFFCGSAAFAQLVGDNAFLQGAWLQACVAPNGSWGNSMTAPAGYSTRTGSSVTYIDPITGVSCGCNGVDFAYDQGHDGWTVGAVPWYGCFYLPGTPFDGWSVQMDGVMGQAFYNTSGYQVLAPGVFSGTVTSYTGPSCWSPHAAATGTWSGSFGLTTPSFMNTALQITQVNEVDTFASWMTVTTKFTNTTDTTLYGVYYFATADPDNDEVLPGGGFPTNNHVAYQGGLYDRHEVWARPTNLTHQDGFSGLATQDCRAKVLIYQSWPPGLSATNNLDLVWNQTVTGMGGTYYPVGSTTLGQDIAFGIVFKVGDIPPGESRSISYAWIFGDTVMVDSIFTVTPQLSTLGKLYNPTQPDTVLGCDLLGCDVINDSFFTARIVNGENRKWAFSHWTWAPATGLSATTGTSVIIDIGGLAGPVTYTITGTPDTADGSCEYPNPVTFTLYCQPCFSASYHACYMDTLFLVGTGDTAGATFTWSGPGGFTHTGESTYRFPASYADTGVYRLIKTVGLFHDTVYTDVQILWPSPTVTLSDNSPLCLAQQDTLDLFLTPITPGDTYKWTGPNGFTSTLADPFVPGFGMNPLDVGSYTVKVTSIHGCKSTQSIFADTITRPLPPIVFGPQRYCQGDAFVPWAVTGLDVGGRILWYLNNIVPPGDTLLTAPSPFMTVPGVYVFYFSQKSGSCESPRDSIKVRIFSTPSAPLLTGPNPEYCQHIGPIDTLTMTPNDSLAWYFNSTGGTPIYFHEPLPNIDVANTYPYWVTRTDSGCESPRTNVTIVVNPKPNPPIVTLRPICQYWDPQPLSVVVSSPGDVLTWFGPGIPPTGTSTVPVPGTTVAPDTTIYKIIETSIHGCISDSATDANVIKVRPPMPVTTDIRYCQHAHAAPLNGLVDSIGNSHLNWYYNTVTLNPTPVPFTDTIPGIYTWYVSQTVPNDSTGCESDSAAVNVTIIYKPVFGIHVSAPYVCQFDSLTLSYCCGQDLFAPNYMWTLSAGEKVVSGTHLYDSLIKVEFDSANQNNYVYLRASDDSGFCFSDDTVRINVIGHPNMSSFTKGDVCLGDTVQLALADRTPGAYAFTWYIDGVLLPNSKAIDLIVANSNSGGPYEIRWVDSGMHVVTVSSESQEGCKSYPAYDSVNVHTMPDAGYRILKVDSGGVFCLEDSVLFSANNQSYNYSYMWSPVHYFNNINKPVIYGRMEGSLSTVTLTVTDPFGCYASTSQTLEPQTCCSVIFPNAFTPNGNENRTFRPIFSGYHRFHEFRIVNRWGVTVFECGNTDVKWDGNYNGVPQDMGTYFYYLKYDCGGKTIEAKGDLTLIR